MDQPQRFTGPHGFDEVGLLASQLVASVETHARIDSTNDQAKRSLDEGFALPRLIVAEQQTAGRGRGGNRWWSSGGSLTFSLLIRPSDHGLTLANQAAMSVTTAVALCDQIASTTPLSPTIKWPNDVYIGSKKVAGILLEAPRPDRLVLGVGLNLNNDFSPAPDEVRQRAASLAALAGTDQAPGRVLCVVLDALMERVAQLASGDSALPAEWNRLSALTGARVTLAVGPEALSGECVGLDDDGALLLRNEGVTRRHTTGVVTAIDPPI